MSHGRLKNLPLLEVNLTGCSCISWALIFQFLVKLKLLSLFFLHATWCHSIATAWQQNRRQLGNRISDSLTTESESLATESATSFWWRLCTKMVAISTVQRCLQKFSRSLSNTSEQLISEGLILVDLVDFHITLEIVPAKSHLYEAEAKRPSPSPQP